MRLPGRLATAIPALGCALLPLATACGSEGPPGSSSSGTGGDSAGAGGAGVEACAPGHSTAEDGTCIPAGVPPTLCAEGFEADDAGGCTAIVPPMPCPPGTIAVPGDTTCREIMPCGDGIHGDIPVDAATQYVDASAPVGGTGTAAQPWSRIQDAIDAADEGALIAVAEGSYQENLSITKPVRLWGRCPSMVEVAGPDAMEPALRLTGAGGTVVRGLSLTGPAWGGIVSSAVDAIVEQVWIHDTPQFGFMVDGSSSHAELRGSLVESTGIVGVVAQGATLTVETSAIRDTRPRPSDGKFGRGLQAQNDSSGTRAAVTVRGSLLERNIGSALFTNGSDLTVESSLVRDTVLPELEPRVATGAAAQYEPGRAQRPTLTVRSSVFERNGITGVGADVTLVTSVVRGSGAGELDRGLSAGIFPETADATTLEVSSSLIDGARMFGILVNGSSAVIESSILRNTELLEGRLGMGLLATYDGDRGMRANVVLRACLIEKNHTSGIHAQGSDVTLEGCDVSDNLPQAGDGFYGRGLQTQLGQDGTTTSTATIRGCAFRRNYEAGILVVGGSADIEDTIVEQTRVGSLDGELGDGIAVVSPEPSAASASIRRVVLVQNGRAGLASFGAAVRLGEGRLECNPIDLHGDAHDGHPFQLIDEGGNTCGCEGVGNDCVTSSAMLAPPTTLPPQEL